MSDAYTMRSIVLLEGLEPVRRRPGMYLGDIHDGSGLRHLLWEIVANSIDEHLAGHATKLRVSVEGDLLEVEDDGRGIPIAVHSPSGVSAVEHILTSLHAGPTRDGHVRHVHIAPSLHGVGLAAVNAVSDPFEIEIRREGYVWRQRYACGRPLTSLERGERTERTGTRIRLRPDRTIFRTPVSFDRAAIRERLVEVARFNPELTVELMSERLSEPKGLVAWIEAMAEEREVEARDVLFTRDTVDGVAVEVALAWTDAPDCELRSFCGQNETPDGGTHERGFWDAVVAAVWAQRPGTARPPRASRVRNRLCEGLLAVVHVGLFHPRYGGPTRGRLEGPEVAHAVRAHLTGALGGYLARRPELARRLLARIT